MQIFVKANKTYIIEADYNTSINYIKDTINKKLELKTNNYYLLANGKILENNKYITDYKIDNFTTIHLHFRPTAVPKESIIEFFIKLDKSYNISMCKTDKLIDLKNLINKKFNFRNSKYYYLIFNGKILEDNNKTLEEYELQKDSNIYLNYKTRF